MNRITGQRVIAKLLEEGETKRKQRQHLRRQTAQIVIAALRAHDLTQETIGEQVGLTQAAISRYVHESATPTVATLKCLIDLARKRRIALPELNGWREL